MSGLRQAMTRLQLELRDTQTLLRAKDAALGRAITAVDAALEEVVKTPFEGFVQESSRALEHRRAHRPGRPAKLDADPELQAFVRARLPNMTFHQIEDAVAQAFTPERRVRKSAIHLWWQNNCRKP